MNHAFLRRRRGMCCVFALASAALAAAPAGAIVRPLGATADRAQQRPYFACSRASTAR